MFSQKYNEKESVQQKAKKKKEIKIIKWDINFLKAYI